MTLETKKSILTTILLSSIVMFGAHIQIAFGQVIDTDGDGIEDNVDLQPTVFSNDFNDFSLGGITSGSIVDRGDQEVRISDLASPEGIEINVVTPGGANPAVIEACGATQVIILDAGEEEIVTCTNADVDGDGIEDSIDLQPTVFSNDFNDFSLGGTTDGSIIDRGDQVLAISDLASPDGIKINTGFSGGANPAVIEVCGATQVLTLDAGEEEIVTCIIGDVDGDGIEDNVDLQPTVFSNDFNDFSLGGTTDGSIVDRGDQEVRISDLASPEGIEINVVTPGGANPAVIEVCNGAASISFDPGEEALVTCSSVTVNATSGQLDITFFGLDGTEATTSLNQGNTVTFDQIDFSFTAPATNIETLIITVNGRNNPIAPGSTVPVPLQTANPDSDPTLRWVNGIGQTPCTDLDTFNCVDETFRDDNDYIQTIGLGKSNSDKQFYTLSDMSDPMTSSGHVLRYTITEADVGVNPVELDIILRQGETVIASFHHENLPTGFTLIEQTLSAAQADAITDYTDLELTLDGNCDNTCKNSPGNREKIQVSWIEFAIMATS